MTKPERPDPNEVFTLTRPEGEELPLLVSVPHTGLGVPDWIAERFTNDTIRELPDTDRHLDRVYDFVPAMGATLLCAKYSRYVVDLNRPADGHALYPGRDETGLVPRSSFGEVPIYREGTGPDDAEVQQRVEWFWKPYHDTLRRELDRLHAVFGYALLWDGHSITSVVPRFFEGSLPALMLGDVEGKSADPSLSAAVLEVQNASDYSVQPNAPFKGGYITRSHGDPANGFHALQLEMTQRIYMDEESPFAFDAAKANALVPVLRDCLLAYCDAAKRLS